MKEETSKRLTANETREIINALETAIINHGRWLTSWHQGLLCKLPLSKDVMAKNAHQLSEFGQWYYHEKSQILKDHPDFIAIDTAYRDLHEKARYLSQQEQIEHEDYELFLDAEVKLSGLMIGLRDEFQEALFSFDSLTHVLNRQAFLRLLTQEHARSVRTGNHSCIVMIDLDNFKQINDTYGHHTGDKTLQDTAHYLVNHLRPYDTMCRYGGEEFLICLPQTRLEIAKRIVNRLQKGLANHKIKISKSDIISVTASFGISVTEESVSMMDTITRADSAMYAAKHGGGNRVIIWGDKA